MPMDGRELTIFVRSSKPSSSTSSKAVASGAGGGADVFLDRPKPKDEQRLREAVCERGSVGICCHESPHAEAVDPPVRTFHTVSLGTSVNKGDEAGPELLRPSPASCFLLILALGLAARTR